MTLFINNKYFFKYTYTHNFIIPFSSLLVGCYIAICHSSRVSLEIDQASLIY